MDTEKIKVLYITGSGRSGSTVLQSILGQIDGFISVGELRYVWERGFYKNKLCGCGVPFQECELWKEVLKETSEDLAKFDPYQLYRLTESFRLHQLPFTLLPAIKNNHLSRLSGYLGTVENLYHVVHNITGSRVIVDSSKNPAYGYLLSMLPSIDMYTVHFIRDARAVAYSWSKKKLFIPDTVNPEYMPQRNPVRSALQWNARNAAAEIWLRRPVNKYLHLRYEDFVRNPQPSVERILNLLAEPAHELPFVSERSVQLDKNHTVFGNVVRFQTGTIDIKLDSEWRREMSSFYKTAVTYLTWPLLLKYGYVGAVRNERNTTGMKHENRMP